MSKSIEQSRDYHAYLLGLKRLHALIASGQDETEAGDAIRDEMDGPWHGMSDTERRRLSNLSGDLYSLTDPPHQVREMNPQADQRLAEVLPAMNAGELDLALTLLRRWGAFLSPADLAAKRGCAWLNFGDADTAMLFLEAATRLEPQNAEYARLYFAAFEGTESKAVPDLVVETVKHGDDLSPELFFGATSALLSRIQWIDAIDGISMEGLIEAINRKLPQLSKHSQDLRIIAFVMLGFLYNELDQTDRALSSYSAALTLDPKNSALYVARATLQLRMKSGDPVADARMAIHYDSTLAHPYLIIIHHALMQKQFDQVVKIAERALRLGPTDEIACVLYECMAISLSELHEPKEEVLRAFRRAIELSPHNLRLRRNCEEFEQHSGQCLQMNWAFPTEIEVSAAADPKCHPMLTSKKAAYYPMPGNMLRSKALTQIA